MKKRAASSPLLPQEAKTGKKTRHESGDSTISHFSGFEFQDSINEMGNIHLGDINTAGRDPVHSLSYPLNPQDLRSMMMRDIRSVVLNYVG